MRRSGGGRRFGGPEDAKREVPISSFCRLLALFPSLAAAPAAVLAVSLIPGAPVDAAGLAAFGRRQPPERPPGEQPPTEGEEQPPIEGEGPPPTEGGEPLPPEGEEQPPTESGEPPATEGGGEGEEDSGDPGEAERGSTPDLTSAPRGILPGRWVASPAPSPGSPVVGLVFGAAGFAAHTGDGTLVAYTADAERARWGLSRGSAAFLGEHGGHLVILDPRGEVTLRGLTDGMPKGRFPARPAAGSAGKAGPALPIPVPAAVSGGALYWVAGGSFQGIDLASGARIPEYALPGGESAAMVPVPLPLSVGAGGGGRGVPRLLVSLGDAGVASIVPLPGKAANPLRWHFSDTGRVSGPILALPKTRLAIFGDAGGDLHALDLETGRRRWRWRLAEGFHHPPLASRSRLYAATEANTLYCHDEKGGGERWRAALPGRPAAPPIRVAGALLVVTRDGILVEIDANTGARIGLPHELEAEVTGVVRRRADEPGEAGWMARRLYLGLRDGRLAILGPRIGGGGEP